MTWQNQQGAPSRQKKAVARERISLGLKVTEETKQLID